MVLYWNPLLPGSSGTMLKYPFGPVILISGRDVASGVFTATPLIVQSHASGTELPTLNVLPAGGGRSCTSMNPNVSVTVTVKLPPAVLLCVSVAEQLTVVVPITNNEPDAGAHATGLGPS